MKYSFKKNFFLNCYKNLLKFGKVKSNYFKLKKIKKKISFLLKKNTYLIRISFKKGDNSLVGELGMINYHKQFFLL